MNDAQVGSVFRAVRIRRGLRQGDVATAAGVSQPLVSSIERGYLTGTSLNVVRRVARVLGISVALEPRWRGPELPKLLDERHAALVMGLVERLAALGWTTLPEHTFSIGGERGSIDVLAWNPSCRAMLVIEVKTALVDLQDLLSTLDRKRRLAPSVSRLLGWRPLFYGTLVVMPAETRARNAVARFGAVFEAAYPARGRQVQSWLRLPSSDLRGIWFLLNITGGDRKHPGGGSMRVRPGASGSSALFHAQTTLLPALQLTLAPAFERPAPP